MSDTSEINRISRMSTRELLDYVLADPSVIADSYYRHFGQAVRNRAKALQGTPEGWTIERVDDRHIRVTEPRATYAVVLDLSDQAYEMRVFWRLLCDLMGENAQEGTV